MIFGVSQGKLDSFRRRVDMIFGVSQGRLNSFRRRVDMIFGVSQGRLDTLQRRVDNTYLRPPHHDLMYVFKATKWQGA